MLAENVARIIQRAYSKRETAAADAAVQLIAQASEAGNPVCAPGSREFFPVIRIWSALARKGFEGFADCNERDARPLSDFNESHAAEDFACVTALIARSAPASDKPFRFIKMKR